MDADELKETPVTNAEASKFEETLLDKIKHLLSSKQMKSSKIAIELGVSKKEINQVLYSHTELFTKDIFFNWRMK